MLKIDRDFVLGSFEGVCELRVKNGDPLEFLLKRAFDIEFIDGVLTSDGNLRPTVFTCGKDLTVSKTSFWGVNSYLKKAVQKFRLSKLCVVAPSCVLDGVNKTQYYGIGCNWVRTAIALKIGVVCVGYPLGDGCLAEMLDVCGRKEGIVEYRFDEKGLVAVAESGFDVVVPIEIHSRYVNPACNYCFNLSAKGADLSYVRKKEGGIFFVRSERGWRILWLIQRSFPRECEVKVLHLKNLHYIEKILEEKLKINVDLSLERFEIGLPEPKWNENRFSKLYRAWNSLNDMNNGIEEVF